MYRIFAGTVILTILMVQGSYAQWKRPPGPYGATVDALANIGPIEFIASGSNIFRTSDGGLNWTRVDSSLGNTYIYSMTSVGTVLAAVTDYDNILVSYDSGSSWRTVGYNLPISSAYYDLCSDSNRLFVRTDADGIYFSNNNGSSWSPMNDGLPTDYEGYVLTSALGCDGPYIFAAWNGDIYRNLPSGGTWTNMHLSLSDTNEGNARITCFSSCGDYLFVGSDSVGVYRSGLDGRGYRQFNAGLADSSILALQSNGNSVYAATPGGLFASIDFGVTWRAINTVDTPILHLSVANNSIYLATGNGIFISSDDGNHWTLSSNGLDYAAISSLYVNDGYLFTASNYGSYRSTNGGTNWTWISNGPTVNKAVTAFTNVGSELFAGTGDGLFLSTDNGDHWANSTDSLPYSRIDRLTATDSLLFVTALENFYDRRAHLYLSLDTGKSWRPFDFLNTATTSLSQNSLTYVAGYQGSAGVVYQSTNSGGWREADSGIREFGIYGGNAYGVETLIPVHESMFAGTDGGIFLTTNNGFSWIRTGGLPLTSYSAPAALTALFFIDSCFIAATNIGVYASTDSGATWIETDSGLGNTSKVISAAALQNSTLYVGLQSVNYTGQEVGLFARSVAEIERSAQRGSEKGTPEGVQEVNFNIECEIYPNPSTGILIVDTRGAKIESLNVINVLGEDVLDLKYPASHLEIDVNNLPPGIYYVHILTTAQTFVRTFVKE